ncbi:MAG: M48 family metalloprotease [Deltaproteobacteria bacterium]|nr:M48 family metalloprotease [Deltaproteobacteria bacterium]
MSYRQVFTRLTRKITFQQTISLGRRPTIFLCLAALLLQPILLNPALAFSVGKEKKVGDKLLSMVRTSFTLIDAPDVTQYINNLGQRILKVTGPQYFKYHFFVIKNKDFNAFAAPDGLIFIHSGLLEAMDKEGELVSVMAHEIGHVTSRHISKMIAQRKKNNIGTAALLIAGIALGGGAISQALITGSMAANASMNLKFSRKDEEEADRLSYKWMKAMGMNPAPMATMLEKMYKVSVYQMANIPPYLLTHPEPKRRLSYIRDMLRSEPPHHYKHRDDFPFLRIKYRITAETGDLANLRSIYRRQAKQGKEPRKTMANYGLYMIYLADADYKKAEASLRIVMNHFKDRAILQSDQGIIEFRQEKYNAALKDFKSALKAKPDDAYSAYHLAKTLEYLGKKTQAIKIYQRLLLTIPDYTKLNFRLGKLLFDSGKTGAGHYQLGVYFWLNGNHKMAKYHLKQALADKTSDRETIKLTNKELKLIQEVEKE